MHANPICIETLWDAVLARRLHLDRLIDGLERAQCSALDARRFYTFRSLFARLQAEPFSSTNVLNRQL